MDATVSQIFFHGKSPSPQRSPAADELELGRGTVAMKGLQREAASSTINNPKHSLSVRIVLSHNANHYDGRRVVADVSSAMPRQGAPLLVSRKWLSFDEK